MYDGKSQSNTSLNTIESWLSSRKKSRGRSGIFLPHHSAMSKFGPSNLLFKMAARTSGIACTFKAVGCRRGGSKTCKPPWLSGDVLEVTPTTYPVTSPRWKLHCLSTSCGKCSSLDGHREVTVSLHHRYCRFSVLLLILAYLLPWKWGGQSLL